MMLDVDLVEVELSEGTAQECRDAFLARHERWCEARRARFMRRWTDAEIAALRRWYSASSIALQQALPGRTLRSIRSQARRLGVCARPQAWTPGEVELLRKGWHRWGRRKLLQALPGRSWLALERMATTQGIRATDLEGLLALRTAARRIGTHPATLLAAMRAARGVFAKLAGRRRKKLYRRLYATPEEYARTYAARVAETPQAQKAIEARALRKLLDETEPAR